MSPSQSQNAEPQGVESYFTDVEELRERFKELVIAPTLTKRILVIHGVGGVGKSSLLRMFRLQCKSARVPVALVSGDRAKSEVELFSQWADDLKVGNVLLPKFTKTLAHYRVTLAQVEDQVAKTAEKITKETIKTLAEMVLSTIPGISPILRKLGRMSAEALIDWLRGQGFAKPDIDFILDPAKKLTEDFLLDIEQIAPSQRLVLMLDTFEKVTTLENWMCDFAQRLNANLLLVIAGRAMPNWDRQWPSWLAQSNVEALELMDRNVTRELAQNYYKRLSGGDLDAKQAEGIIEFARGLPIAITSTVDLMVKYHAKNFRAILPKVIDDLARRLSEDVPEKLKPALQVAAALRWFDEPTMRVLLQKVDVSAEYGELERFPFVVIRDERFALHDVVRDTLDANLRVRDPDLHRELHERAAMYFEEQMTKRTSDETELFALERLYHRIHANEETGIKIFQEMAEEFTRYWLVNQLRVLMNDVNTYPLQQENSKLWREYYHARVADLEERSADAKSVYEAIGNTRKIEPKLRAYALCDLGNILARREYLIFDSDGQKAQTTLEKSLNQGIGVDLKLFNSFWALGDLNRRLNDLEEGLPYYQRAIEYVEGLGDRYTATRLRQNIVVKLLFHGRLGAISGYSKLLSEMSTIYTTYPILAIEFREGIAVPSIWMGNAVKLSRSW